MTEHLRELAQAAKNNDRGGGHVAWENRGMDTWNEDEAAFIRATSPHTVLALLDATAALITEQARLFDALTKEQERFNAANRELVNFDTGHEPVCGTFFARSCSCSLQAERPNG